MRLLLYRNICEILAKYRAIGYSMSGEGIEIETLIRLGRTQKTNHRTHCKCTSTLGDEYTDTVYTHTHTHMPEYII